MILISLFSIVLVACGGATEELELAPERPYGSITGRIHNGSVSEGQVTAYTFAAIDSRAFLGKSEINENGEFQIQIQAPSQIILLEVDAKSYTESASNVVVDVEGKVKLTSLVNYVSGETHRATVNPITHIISGLTFYNYGINKPADIAFEESKDAFEDLYSIALIQNIPANNTSVTDEITDSEEELLYGLLLAGLSKVTEKISRENEPNLHETINSWYLSQLIRNDLLTDGVLNGVWSESANSKSQKIVYGTTTLNGSLLQIDLASAIMDTALFTLVRDKIDAKVLETFLLDISRKGSAILNSEEKEPLNTPVITLKAPLQNYYAGTLQITADVSGILKLKNLTFFLDNKQIENDLNDIYTSKIIDSTGYIDGRHTLKIEATDEFGYKATSSYEIAFDNTSPGFTIASALKTNSKNYRLKGSISDGLSGVKQILINQTNAVIDVNNDWFIDLELSEGTNSIPVTLEDMSGNTETNNITVVLDTTTPEINTSNYHSEATFFIENDNYVIDKLENANNLPVSLMTDKLTLNGEPISATTLNYQSIPYFSFKVSDPISGDHASPFSKLGIAMRVEKNAEVIRDWIPLTAVDAEQFYIPIVREILGDAIEYARASDQFLIRVKVSDEAGNESIETFEFTIALLSPAQEINLASNEVDESWFNTGFENRTQLYDKEMPALTYNYVNTSTFPVYIQISDSGNHSAIHTHEEVIRENKVRLKTTPYWRIGKVDNPRKKCPKFDGSWQPVSQIHNFNSDGVWEEKKPEPTISDAFNITQDVMPGKPDSPWWDMPDFDNSYEQIEVKSDAGDVLTYTHDYVVDTGISGMSQPALVTNWQLYTSADDTTAICDSERHFQYMEKYQYLQEPGYPRNNIIEETDEALFATSKYKVIDEDGSEISRNNGWYKVAAQHKVSIIKFVTTNSFDVYNDNAVATPDLINDYNTHKLDRNITWEINQGLNIEFAHDLSNMADDNIVSKRFIFREGFSRFTIAR